MLATVSEVSTGTPAWFWPLKVNEARGHMTDDLSAGAVNTLHAGHLDGKQGVHGFTLTH